ncbi:MAG: glycosyltransferase family 1 protein [Bacteroidetes bacterium]|nr:MAG: glycosyltransferase family 1 protein [Bacteroidota bacterium]
MNRSSEYLHIVAFDIPYPANYGGVIDIYYKVEALHELGVKVILHCYQYGREKSAKLEKIAHKVFYYQRRTFRNPFYGRMPYIVATRNTSELLQNLKKDKHPILFEGLHCTYYLDHPDLAKRIKVVRTHNVEHDYYKKLEEVETNFFKKYFFRIESERLKKHESILKHANLIAAISPSDFNHFHKKFEQVIYLPAFHPNKELRSVNGSGEYALYHGNLAVGENDEAAKFLVNEVFKDLDYPFYIAGSNPSKELTAAIEGKPHIQILNNLDSTQMLDYVKNAQVNVLPTFQNTGIKLKLINALFLGRHCLANSFMVQNTGLESFCEIANTPKQFSKKLQSLIKTPFSKEQIEARRTALELGFSNSKNAQLLVETIRSKKK